MSKLSIELKSLTRLALPVALSQLAIMGMGITDVLLAGHAGTDELAGLSLGANIWCVTILFFFGIGLITQALVGRYYGAGDMQALRKQVHQSIWLTLVCGLLGVLTILLAAEILLVSGFEPVMAGRAHDYLQAIAWGAVPMTMLAALRGSLEAMNLTQPVFWINFVVFLMNIPLDYALVYGVWGFPKLGAEGCAWATACLLWVGFFASAAMLQWHKNIRHVQVFKNFSAPDMTIILSTLRLGFPIGLSVLIEMSMFAGAGMLIAYFGPIAAAANSIAISIASASFMIYLGFAAGVTIRASQQLGAESFEGARYSVKVGTSFNVLLAFVLSFVFLIFRDPLVSLYSNDAEVVRLAAQLLLLGAAFQVVDCLQAATIAALRAYHDTVSAPKIQMFAYWLIGLPVAIWLGFYSELPWISGPHGFWVAMFVSLTISGLLLLRRLLKVLAQQH